MGVLPQFWNLRKKLIKYNALPLYPEAQPVHWCQDETVPMRSIKVGLVPAMTNPILVLHMQYWLDLVGYGWSFLLPFDWLNIQSSNHLSDYDMYTQPYADPTNPTLCPLAFCIANWSHQQGTLYRRPDWRHICSVASKCRCVSGQVFGSTWLVKHLHWALAAILQALTSISIGERKEINL